MVVRVGLMLLGKVVSLQPATLPAKLINKAEEQNCPEITISNIAPILSCWNFPSHIHGYCIKCVGALAQFGT